MAVNVLTEAIEQGVPLVVLSPHLDDAVLSCGGAYDPCCQPHVGDRRDAIHRGRPRTIHAVGATVPASGRGT